MTEIDTLADIFIDAMFIHGQGIGKPLGLLTITDISTSEREIVKGHRSLLGVEYYPAAQQYYAKECCAGTQDCERGRGSKVKRAMGL